MQSHLVPYFVTLRGPSLRIIFLGLFYFFMSNDLILHVFNGPKLNYGDDVGTRTMINARIKKKNDDGPF